MLQRSIGNQATLRLLPQRASNLSDNQPGGDHEQEGTAENITPRGATPGVLWDFRKIPVFPPDWPSGLQTSLRLSSLIQPKLVVGEVNDPLEHEANYIAEKVMRIRDPQVSVAAAPPQFSRKCAACEDEEKLQKKPTGPKAATGEAPGIVHEVLLSPGQPLDDATRAAFEPRFRHDFSFVRVHTDSAAAESAKRVHALAYTVGSDIVFGSSQYSPETKAGRSLLAHELTHVIQQRQAPVKASLLQAKLPIGDPDNKFEREAEAAADRFADMGGRLSEHSGPAVQRQSDYTAETEAATEPDQEPPSGSIDITETLFEEDTDAPGQLQASPDPALVQRQRQDDIPPPPPAYPSIYTWFFDISGADVDFGSLFNLTCEDGRERGFYVMWNEHANKSFAGPVAIGDRKRGCEAPRVNLGPVPPDRKPVYPVGFFHTHPLANPGCIKSKVGPSGVDRRLATDTGLPGLVEDTGTTTSGCEDANFFFFGPVRRS